MSGLQMEANRKWEPSTGREEIISLAAVYKSKSVGH